MELSTLLLFGVVSVTAAVVATIFWARARHHATQTDRFVATSGTQSTNVARIAKADDFASTPYEQPVLPPTDFAGALVGKEVVGETREVLPRIASELPDDDLEAERVEPVPSALEVTVDEIETNAAVAAGANFSAPDELAPVGPDHGDEETNCSPIVENEIERDLESNESCEADDPSALDEAPGWDDEQADIAAVTTTRAANSEVDEETHALTERASKRKRPTAYRDQRGKRRAKTPTTASASPPSTVTRAPAEASLRLTLHAIQKVAALTIVLSRPDGYPESISPLVEGHEPIDAYDDGRYDDLEIPWTSDLLSSEIRIQSAEGFQWLRASRRIHIFVSDPSEAGLVVTGSARAGATHAIICPQEDASSVVSCCEQTGSSPPLQLDRWSGIPHGWCILTDFKPAHTPIAAFPTTLQTLDPGIGTEITLSAGLALRSRVYAEGHPPQIRISALPAVATVAIDGAAAIQNGDIWTASGWDSPGQHVIDIVPGPSLSYEIAPDPAFTEGWDHFDAHAGRFSKPSNLPWSNAAICGAVAASSSGACLYAIEPHTGAVAIGPLDATASLAQRLDVPVSAGFVPFWPAFIVCTSGMRRAQGRVMWLGIRDEQSKRRKADPHWVSIVRSATARHLTVDTADPAGLVAWQNAKKRARRQRRSTR